MRSYMKRSRFRRLLFLGVLFLLLIYLIGSGRGLGTISFSKNAISDLLGSTSDSLLGGDSMIGDPIMQELLTRETLSDEEQSKVINFFGFDPSDVKSIQAETLVQIHRSKLLDIGKNYHDWMKRAYVQYATDLQHICPALINFRRLKNLNARADFVLIYAGNRTEIELEGGDELDMLDKVESVGATIKYVKPIDLQSESSYWSKSFTKLYAFGLTQYERLVFIDSDSLVLRNMDELFTLPDSILATPVNYLNFRDFSKINMNMEGAIMTPYDRTNALLEYYSEKIDPETRYDDIEWLMKTVYPSLPSLRDPIKLLDAYGIGYQLASYVMVIHPDSRILKALLESLKYRSKDQYDMDILNEFFNLKRITGDRSNLYRISEKDRKKYIPLIQVIPHNPYALLSGEFRELQRSHDCYLSDPLDLPELGYRYPSLDFPGSPEGSINDDDEGSFIYPEIPYWSWYWNRELTTYGWGAESIVKDAKLVHFSDTPLPKPWQSAPKIMDKLLHDAQKKCLAGTDNNKEACVKELQVWLDLYDEYHQSIRDYC
ncbi:DEKNAAC101689 [Brettanomyces naardenensis]|uniref:DEKNAAC101689 n=1 Tax=Brettanomyces naardenensis TaxID=13370 RepID=A0A448YIY3_BRENA|nr:DEKNAAC101689 [Brettanomyces naardenensis]